MNIFGPAHWQIGLYAFVQIRVDFLHVVICFLPDMQLESLLIMSSSERWSWIFVYLYFLSVIATPTGLVIYRYVILSKLNLYFRINVGNANDSDKNI